MKGIKNMRTIYFKNGIKKEISQEICNILNKNISESCKDIQMFSDGKDMILLIKISEIVYID